MNTSESHSNTLCRRRFLQLAATVAGTAFAPASAAGSIDNKVNSGNEPSNSLSDLEHDFYNDYTHFASASDTNSIISHANYVRRAYTSRQFSDGEKKIIELLDMRYRGLAAAQLYNIALSGRCLEPERKVALLEIAEALHPRKSTKKIIGAVRADIEKEHNINKRFNSYYQGMVTRVLSDYQLQELYADSMNPSKKLDRGVKKTFDFILPGDDIVAGWKDGHLPSEPKGIDYDVNVSAYKRQTQQFMAAKGLGHLISQKNQTGRKKWEVKEFNYLDAGAVEQAVSTYNRSIAHAKLDEGQMLYSLLTDAIKFDKKRYTESDFAVLQIAQANLRASLAWKEKMAAEKTGDIAEQYAHSITSFPLSCH